MTVTKKNIQISIPENLQKEIEDGTCKIDGTIVRDSAGKFVRHLPSIEVQDKSLYYSPNIVISVAHNFIFSHSVQSDQIRRDIEENANKLSKIERTTYEISQHQENELMSSVTLFNSHFDLAKKQSSLIDMATVFSTGLNAISKIGSHLSTYLKNYIDDTDVKVPHDLKIKKYREYTSSNPNQYSRVKGSKFAVFQQSRAFHFSYCFIQVINDLNVISLIHDGKFSSKYRENLLNLKNLLLESVLQRLIYGVGDEGDIFTMCFSENGLRNDSFDHQDLINKLLKYSEGENFITILKRNREINNSQDFDINRIKSILKVIEILDDIDNLISREEALHGIEFDHVYRDELKKKVFLGT